MNSRIALVIDDDTSIGLAFSIALQHFGFTVEQITDSTIALAEIERIKPDIITLDIHMPVVSGIEILQALRKDSRYTHTKIIVTTAAGTITHDDIVNHLADLVLLKPVSLMQLVQFANRLMDQSNDQA